MKQKQTTFTKIQGEESKNKPLFHAKQILIWLQLSRKYTYCEL